MTSTRTSTRIRQALIALTTVTLLLLGASVRRADQPMAETHWPQPAPAMAYVAEMPAVVPPSAWQAGKDALASHDAAAAIAGFRRALEEHAALAPWIRPHLASALLLAGDTAAALRELDLSAAAAGSAVSMSSLRRAAALRLAAGDRTGARRDYSQLVERSGGEDRRRAQVDLALAVAADGDTVAAIDLIWRVLRAGGNPQVGVLAADELWDLGERSAASAAQLAPVYYEAGHFPRSAALYEQAISAGVYGAGVAAATMQLGRSFERGDEFRAAIGVYRRLLTDHPSYAPGLVRYRLGLCHQRVGEDVEGERWFREVLDREPRSAFADDILYRLAVRRDQKDDRAAARELYERLLARHPRSPWADEAAWKIGFGHFEDGRPEAALAAFSQALRRYPGSDYAPAMGYWRARILEQRGEIAGAREGFIAVLRSASDAYYRGRSASALRRLGHRFSESDVGVAEAKARAGDIEGAIREYRVIRDAGDGEVADRARERARELAARMGAWADLARFGPDALDTSALLVDAPRVDAGLIAAVRGLIELGAWDEATAEIRTLRLDAGSRPERRLMFARLLAEGGAYRAAMREIEGLVRGVGSPTDPAALPPIVSSLLYPGYYGPLVREAAQSRGIDPRFVLAVIREESRFQADVASWAGAQGLMQIMPATGAGVARSLGVPNFNFHMLHDPKVNVSFGTHYMAGLLRDYAGRHHLALAGYNAGPGNANRWLRQNADVPEDVFIERISFRETRNYVKRVLGTWWTYRQLDGESLAAL